MIIMEKDNSVTRIFDNQDHRRARIQAVILASATVISLMSLIYAMFQRSEVHKLRIEVDSLKQQLELRGIERAY